MTDEKLPPDPTGLNEPDSDPSILKLALLLGEVAVERYVREQTGTQEVPDGQDSEK